MRIKFGAWVDHATEKIHAVYAMDENDFKLALKTALFENENDVDKAFESLRDYVARRLRRAHP